MRKWSDSLTPESIIRANGFCGSTERYSRPSSLGKQNFALHRGKIARENLHRSRAGNVAEERKPIAIVHEMRGSRINEYLKREEITTEIIKNLNYTWGGVSSSRRRRSNCLILSDKTALLYNLSLTVISRKVYFKLTSFSTSSFFLCRICFDVWRSL